MKTYNTEYRTLDNRWVSLSTRAYVVPLSTVYWARIGKYEIEGSRPPFFIKQRIYV